MKLICDDYRNVRLEKKVDFILCDIPYYIFIEKLGEVLQESKGSDK